MANLSNTSTGMGIGQGITQGIQNAGQIYGLMRQKQQMDTEEELAPIRKKSLEVGIRSAEAQAKSAETAGKVAEVNLANLEREQAFLTTPYDFGANPMFNDPKVKPFVSSMLSSMPEKVRNTVWAKNKIQEELGKNYAFMHAATTASKDRMEKEAVDLQMQLNAAIKSNNQPEIERIKGQFVQQAEAKRMIEGKMTIAEAKTAIRTLKEQNPALFQKPEVLTAATIAEQTGDLSGLVKSLETAGHVAKTGIEALIKAKTITDPVERAKEIKDAEATIDKEHEEQRRTREVTASHYRDMESQAKAQTDMIRERYKDERQLAAIDKFAKKVVIADPENPDKKTTYVENMEEARRQAQEAFPDLGWGAGPKKPEPKILDAATAQKFLNEAKGDKAKARELAKKAGYEIPPATEEKKIAKPTPVKTPSVPLIDPAKVRAKYGVGPTTTVSPLFTEIGKGLRNERRKGGKKPPTTWDTLVK